MKRKRPTKPLKNDPRRVAVPTLNGFSFQIWRSIHRWVILKEDEVLFLEGAEDIDILAPGRAETIQVGETRASGPISLRSSKVLAAIAHFWEHQERNSELIVFRFLTTSERTRERGDPFGGNRGLDYWDRAKRKSVDARQLRTFLQSQKSLPDSLRQFLRTSTDEELREGLIKRIEWDTGSKQQPFVEGFVNKAVISYGHRTHDLPPAESLRVVPHLLKRALETACQKQDRHLDYPDFMQLFEESLTERISSYELGRYRRAAFAATPSTSSKTDAIGVAFDATLDLAGLPLLERIAKREELVSSLSKRLNQNGLLVLRGSTGTGKSTLANLIAKADVSSWRRLSMRGIEPEQIRDRLLYLFRLVAGDPINDFIIDDLNFDKKVLQIRGDSDRTALRRNFSWWAADHYNARRSPKPG